MSITALQGPVISYGAGINSGYVLDYNPEIGPSLFWGATGILDPRGVYTYNPGQNFGAPTLGWLGTTRINTMNVIPATKSNTILAAAQHTTANTALTLASANATGLAVGVSGSLYGAVTASGTLTNALCIDPLVASVTANLVINSNIMTVTAVAAGGGVCYNRLAIGMVLKDTTTAANLPTGTQIVGFGTGNNGIGTYILSANATATATGDTVTGIFTGLGTFPVGGGTPTSGTLNAMPYGSAGTVMMWYAKAMCSRVISITSTTSQVAGATFTIVGADVYGTSMTEVITMSGASATTTNGLKAWKYIQSVTPNTTDGTGFYSVGTTDVIGLPIRSDNYTAGSDFDIDLFFNNASIASATGYTAAVTTTPTATTGDVRGTYALQVASNGTLRLIAYQNPNAPAMGVGTLGVGLFGQPQYATL